MTPVVIYRPGACWSVNILPKKNLYDTVKLKLTSTSSSSWKENRKGRGSKYLIIKCNNDLITVIFQECLLTGLWFFMSLIYQIFKVSVDHFLLTRFFYNKWTMYSAMSSFRFVSSFPLTWRGRGWVPKLTGAEAVLSSAQGGAVAGVELRAVIQLHFNAKLHWKEEGGLGILDLYSFLVAVLVSVEF